MKKAVKARTRVGGKIGAGILISAMAFGVFTGCASVPKIASGVKTSTQLAKTEAAQKAYDFVQKVKDNDYQGIQNDDDRLKYLKIDAVASLVDNTIKSDVIYDDAYELASIEEDPMGLDIGGTIGVSHVERFTYTKKDKDNPDKKEFDLYLDDENRAVYNSNNTNIREQVQVSMPYGTECSIEGIKLDDSLNMKSDITNGIMIYTIPYLATEFRATCSTTDWGTLETTAKLITDKKDEKYGKPLEVRFALKESDTLKILEATKTIYNEIAAKVGTEISDSDFSKYVASNKPELATMINTGLKTMSDGNNVKSVIMSSIAQSDKIDTPVYVFNDSGEVYVEAKIQNSWIYQDRLNQSEKVYCRYRIAKDSTNSNSTGYVFTWFAGTESGYPALIGKVNSGWQDWK